jgi:hypothetical protein
MWAAAGIDRWPCRGHCAVSSNPDEVRDIGAVIQDLGAVMARSLVGNLQVVIRVGDLIRALVADPPKVSDVAPNPRALVNRLLDFNIASLRILTDHSLETLNGIISVAESNLRGTGGNRLASSTLSSSAPQSNTVDLRLEGERGARVSAPFLLENFYGRPLDVTFEAESLVAVDREPISASAIAIEPAVVRLPPRGQQVVHISLVLGDQFAAGATYETRVRIVGFEARMVRLIVKVFDRKADSLAKAQPKRKRSAAPIASNRVNRKQGEKRARRRRPQDTQT